jgi:hypothetical protein
LDEIEAPNIPDPKKENRDESTFRHIDIQYSLG